MLFEPGLRILCSLLIIYRTYRTDPDPAFPKSLDPDPDPYVQNATIQTKNFLFDFFYHFKLI
jgi:hypothetical protein